MILLTDEEIEEQGLQVVIGAPPSCIAKAQLKKVVEWLEEQAIWGQVPYLDLEKGEGEWTMRCISEDDWQALLEETK